MSPPPSAPGPAPAATRGRLELRGVSRRFGIQQRSAIEDITLICEPGEFVVVVGPSGCGKSTLLNIAAGLDRPTTGSVMIDGRPVTEPGPDRTMVFQEHALFPWMTAVQNVELGLRIKGLSARQRREAAVQALALVRLSDAHEKLPHELSGGMRQRVAIARALVLDPAVLLMDEPFSALDAQTRTMLHEQMQDLWQATHKTILFITHSVGEAVRLADRVIVLHSNPGRIRREVRVNIPHPRDFDSPEISEVVGVIRQEIEEEVNRIHALA